MKDFGKFLLLVLLTTSIIISCSKKEEEEPPPDDNTDQGEILTIADIYQIYQDSIVSLGGSRYKFTDGYTLNAVVTMDDILGNIYKCAYIEDGTHAICIHLLSSGGLSVGDNVRILLKDAVLKNYYGILELDSVDISKISKVAVGQYKTPMKVSINELNANVSNPSYLCKLIKIDSVEFVNSNATWADAVNYLAVNQSIQDINKNEMTVRTRGYADFAGDSLPKGNGTIIAVFSPYNASPQLYVRDPDELSMTGPLLVQPDYLNKDFDDQNVFSGGWTEQKVTGNVGWSIYAGTDPAAKISNYSGGSIDCETWLISPSIDLSPSTLPLLSFNNCSGYSGAELELWISVNYIGTGLPSSATWTQLIFTLCPQSPYWSWTSSGDIDLSAYKYGNVYIAFRYTGTSTDGRTWELDDIVVREQ